MNTLNTLNIQTMHDLTYFFCNMNSFDPQACSLFFGAVYDYNMFSEPLINNLSNGTYIDSTYSRKLDYYCQEFNELELENLVETIIGVEPVNTCTESDIYMLMNQDRVNLPEMHTYGFGDTIGSDQEFTSFMNPKEQLFLHKVDADCWGQDWYSVSMNELLSYAPYGGYRFTLGEKIENFIYGPHDHGWYYAPGSVFRHMFFKQKFAIVYPWFYGPPGPEPLFKGPYDPAEFTAIYPETGTFPKSRRIPIFTQIFTHEYSIPMIGVLDLSCIIINPLSIDYRFSHVLMMLNNIYVDHFNTDEMIYAFYNINTRIGKIIFMIFYDLHVIMYLLLAITIYGLFIKSIILSYKSLRFIIKQLIRFIYSIDYHMSKRSVYGATIKREIRRHLFEFRRDYGGYSFLIFKGMIYRVLYIRASFEAGRHSYAAYLARVDIEINNPELSTKKSAYLKKIKHYNIKRGTYRMKKYIYMVYIHGLVFRIFNRIIQTVVFGSILALSKSIMLGVMHESRLYGGFYIIFFYIYGSFYRLRKFWCSEFNRRVGNVSITLRNEFITVLFFTSNFDFARQLEQGTWLPFGVNYYTQGIFYYSYPDEYDPGAYKFMYSIQANPTREYQTTLKWGQKGIFLWLYSLMNLIVYSISIIFFYIIKYTRYFVGPVSIGSVNIFITIKLAYLGTVHKLLFSEFNPIYMNRIKGFIVGTFATIWSIIIISSSIITLVSGSFILKILSMYGMISLILFALSNIFFRISVKSARLSLHYTLILSGVIISNIFGFAIGSIRLLLKILFYIILKLKYIIFIYMLHLAGFNIVVLLDFAHYIFVDTLFQDFIRGLDKLSSIWWNTYQGYIHEDIWLTKDYRGAVRSLKNLGWFKEWAMYMEELVRFRESYWLPTKEDPMDPNFIGKPNFEYGSHMRHRKRTLLCIFEFLYNYPCAYFKVADCLAFEHQGNTIIINTHFTNGKGYFHLYTNYWLGYDYLTYCIWHDAAMEGLIEMPIEYNHTINYIMYIKLGPKILNGHTYYMTHNIDLAPALFYIKTNYLDSNYYLEEYVRHLIDNNFYKTGFFYACYRVILTLNNVCIHIVSLYDSLYNIYDHELYECMQGLYDGYYRDLFIYKWYYDDAEGMDEHGYIIEPMESDDFFLFIRDYLDVFWLMIEDVMSGVFNIDYGRRNRLDFWLHYAIVANIKTHKFIDLFYSYIRLDPIIFDKFKNVDCLPGYCTYGRGVTNIDNIEPIDIFANAFDIHSGCSFNELHLFKQNNRNQRMPGGAAYRIIEYYCIYTCRTTYVAIIYFAILIVYIPYILFDIGKSSYKKAHINVVHSWTLFRNRLKQNFDGLSDEEDTEIREFFTLSETEHDKSFKSKLSKKAYKLYTKYLARISKAKNVFRSKNDDIAQAEGGDFVYISKSMRKVKSIHKKQFSRIRSDYKRLSKEDRLYLSDGLKEVLDNEYNTTVTFEYKRFLMDPQFASYYNVRISEPTKLEILVAMGLRYNIYLKAIYQQERKFVFTLEDFRNEGGPNYVSLINKIYAYFLYLDYLGYDGSGPIGLYNQDQGTEFLVHNESLGDKCYSMYSTNGCYDSAYILYFIFPVGAIFFAFVNCFGHDWVDSPITMQFDMLASIILSQCETLSELGIQKGIFMQWYGINQGNPGDPQVHVLSGSRQYDTLEKLHPMHTYFRAVTGNKRPYQWFAFFYDHDTIHFTLNPYLWFIGFRVLAGSLTSDLYRGLGMDIGSEIYYVLKILYIIFSIIVAYISYKGFNFYNHKGVDFKGINNNKMFTSGFSIDKIITFETVNYMNIKFYGERYYKAYIERVNNKGFSK